MFYKYNQDSIGEVVGLYEQYMRMQQRNIFYTEKCCVGLHVYCTSQSQAF